MTNTEKHTLGLTLGASGIIAGIAGYKIYSENKNDDSAKKKAIILLSVGIINLIISIKVLKNK